MSRVTRKTEKDLIFLEVADSIGQLGTCSRAHMGAIIVFDGRCISWGYNGAPPGLPHCDENYHGWQGWFEAHDTGKIIDMEAALDRKLSEQGCRNATHAEANAIAFAARQGISTANGTMYVSQSPCETCSRLIVAAGIKAVVYREEYRDPAGINILERAGVRLIQGHR